MELRIDAKGIVSCVYGEEMDLGSLGKLFVRRASSVEPDEEGGWWADLALVGGPRLGPCRLRSAALELERRWLAEHWLANKQGADQSPRKGADARRIDCCGGRVRDPHVHRLLGYGQEPGKGGR